MKQSLLVGFYFSLFLTQMKAADDLPPGVPRIVEANGDVLFVDTTFTSGAFQAEGLRLVIEEANKVARELQLQEALPITSTSLLHAYIGPFGYTYKFKGVGNITTPNFYYGVEQDYKFSDLTITKLNEHCSEYQSNYQWLLNRLDTNAAYQLATQWLTTVHMDVSGLNHDCDAHVALSSDLKDESVMSNRKFTPIYFLWWTHKSNVNDCAAYIELFSPTKTLLQLKMYDSQYILRPPVAFTNLAALFPGKAIISTNWVTNTTPPARPGHN